MMLIVQIYTWSKKMESKVGIISHRPGKTKPSLWDVGTCRQKMVSASLLYFENLPYNANLYSNNRTIFQRFETCKDIFTRHSVTGKIISLGIAANSQTFSSHWMQSYLIIPDKEICFLRGCL